MEDDRERIEKVIKESSYCQTFSRKHILYTDIHEKKINNTDIHEKKDKQHRHTRKQINNTDIRENRTIEKNMLGNTNKKGNGDFAIFRFPLESTARFII